MLSSILDHMHPQWVISYHEHDSLLEHVFDEELSEAERKAAWDSYKQEKAAETARYGVYTVAIAVHLYGVVSQRRARYPIMCPPSNFCMSQDTPSGYLARL